MPNSHIINKGPDVPSAATIRLKDCAIQTITGTTLTTHIDPPYSAFVGQLVVLNSGAWTFATTTAAPDNILAGATTAPTANVPNIFVYDGTYWYIK
jgi:hypothetical protein